MSRYIVLLGLLVAMVAVYGQDVEDCCGANATWNLCGHLCAPTCEDKEPDYGRCPRIRCTLCTAGCRCNEGYIRDTTVGACVLPADCQNITIY